MVLPAFGPGALMPTGLGPTGPVERKGGHARAERGKPSAIWRRQRKIRTLFFPRS